MRKKYVTPKGQAKEQLTHFITLPAQIMRLKGWQKGTELFITIDERSGKVVLDKLEEAAKTEV